MHCHAHIFVRAVNLNLGPCVCSINTLQTELSSQSSFSVPLCLGRSGLFDIWLLGFPMFSADRKTQATCSPWFLFCELKALDSLQLSQFL